MCLKFQTASVVNFLSISVVILLIVIFVVVFGFIIGFFSFKFGIIYRKKIAEAEISSAEDCARKIIEEAEKEAANKKKQAVVEAKDEIHGLREEAEKEIKLTREELATKEKRIIQKEELLERKVEQCEKKEESLGLKTNQAEKMLEEAELIKTNQLNMLEKISGMTKEEACSEILSVFENELIHKKAVKLRIFQQKFKDEVAQEAKNLLSMAIAKYAGECVNEVAVCVVPIRSDEMKGRIIGREGRNIKSFENLTGVNIIIDDTPEAITLSCFDPIRREVARIALNRLVDDGRIHPVKIEKAVEKAKEEVEQIIRSEGERAVMEANVQGINPELVNILGRLKFRTSYGQNVLEHSLEVAAFCGIIASEIDVDASLARRAGLLHDIGKALSNEIEGSHVQIGVEIAKKYKESLDVIHAIEAHHGDVEAVTTIACIVQAADAISAARPGARSENLEHYIKRLEKLEEIANSFEGVESSYALQAGREIRIMVKPNVVKDDDMILLAHNVVKQIEENLSYPGQIKVNIIRESRFEDYAK